MADTVYTQRTRPTDNWIYIAVLKDAFGAVIDHNGKQIKVLADSWVPTEYTERTERVRI